MTYQQQCPVKREAWTNLDPTRPNRGHIQILHPFQEFTLWGLKYNQQFTNRRTKGKEKNIVGSTTGKQIMQVRNMHKNAFYE